MFEVPCPYLLKSLLQHTFCPLQMAPKTIPRLAHNLHVCLPNSLAKSLTLHSIKKLCPYNFCPRLSYKTYKLSPLTTTWHLPKTNHAFPKTNLAFPKTNLAFSQNCPHFALETFRSFKVCSNYMLWRHCIGHAFGKWMELATSTSFFGVGYVI